MSNQITPKEAETKEERFLLGLVEKECKDINYGNLLLELNIKDGVVTFVKTIRNERTYAKDPKGNF